MKKIVLMIAGALVIMVSMTALALPFAIAQNYPAQTKILEKQKQSIIRPINSDWDKYTNFKLGFSINIPKTMMHNFGSCYYDGSTSYRAEATEVPVKIFEAGNHVYISSAYYYQLTGEIFNSNQVASYSGCVKVNNSIALLQDKNNYYERMWDITSEAINDYDELEYYIQNKYGSGCSIGESKPSSQAGTYDIYIHGDGKGMSDTLCPVNGRVVIKFNPDLKKMANWDRGQDYTFYKNNAYIDSYDDEMERSFIFTPVLKKIPAKQFKTSIKQIRTPVKVENENKYSGLIKKYADGGYGEFAYYIQSNGGKDVGITVCDKRIDGIWDQVRAVADTDLSVDLYYNQSKQSGVCINGIVVHLHY